MRAFGAFDRTTHFDFLCKSRSRARAALSPVGRRLLVPTALFVAAGIWLLGSINFQSENPIVKRAASLSCSRRCRSGSMQTQHKAPSRSRTNYRNSDR